jgi:hypothetical protein
MTADSGTMSLAIYAAILTLTKMFEDNPAHCAAEGARVDEPYLLLATRRAADKIIKHRSIERLNGQA